MDFLVISTISTEQLPSASHPSDLPFPSRQALCRFGIPGSLCRGRRPFDPVVKPGCNDTAGAARENFIKLASLWDVLHLGIWGCWPRSPAQRDIGRAWSVGWSCSSMIAGLWLWRLCHRASSWDARPPYSGGGRWIRRVCFVERVRIAGLGEPDDCPVLAKTC